MSARMNSAASGLSGPTERISAARAANFASSGRPRSINKPRKGSRSVASSGVGCRGIRASASQRAAISPSAARAVIRDASLSLLNRTESPHRPPRRGVCRPRGPASRPARRRERRRCARHNPPGKHRQGAPGVRIGRRRGHKVQEKSQSVVVRQKAAAKKNQAMGLMQMGFKSGYGQVRGALGADEQSFGRCERGGVAFRHDEGRTGREARRASTGKHSGRGHGEQPACRRPCTSDAAVVDFIGAVGNGRTKPLRCSCIGRSF